MKYPRVNENTIALVALTIIADGQANSRWKGLTRELVELAAERLRTEQASVLEEQKVWEAEHDMRPPAPPAPPPPTDRE